MLIVVFALSSEFLEDSIGTNRCSWISVFVSRKREFKRASWDLEYVLRALDPSCVRAWCCLAGVQKRMGNDEAYEHCIAKARLYGKRSSEQYVENFIVKIKSDF